MSEFKELYAFTLDKEEEVEKETTRTDKKTGEKITKTKNCLLYTSPSPRDS